MAAILSVAAVIGGSAACASGRRSPTPRPTVIAKVVKAAPPSQKPEPTAAPTQGPARSPTAPASTRADGIGFPWIALADCESGDGPKAPGPPYHPNWSYRGGVYEGGVNFHFRTWDSYRDRSDPDCACDASPAVQIRVAKRVLAREGWGAWPSCSRAIGVRAA